jgi:hypothetical protein
MAVRVRISEDLSLPVDVATQTTLIVGKRGSGKSTTAARVVEQLLRAKVPVAILDPVDSWWGLKAARDGVGQGLSVYVFGGRHADLPLEPGAGALIAEFLCEHRAPLVLSCKHLSGLERSRFMVDFAMTLFRKWTGGVLHLVLEEAHELAPQNPPKGEKAEEMLGAFKRLWKLGRSTGIGGTAITQRPASLHKDITTQSEILVVHRTIGPQDVEAVRQWIKYHQQGEEILPELAHLKTGEAFVWAPEFPEDTPIGLRRVQVLPRETFDSSSTPKHGEHRAEPGDLAAVDLKKLRTKMAATIERAKADDPKELRKTIADLRKQLAAKPVAAQAPVAPKIVEKAILKDAQIARLEAVAEKLLGIGEGPMAKLWERVEANRRELAVMASEIRAAIAVHQDSQYAKPSASVVPRRGGNGLAPVQRPPAPVVPRPVGDATIGKGERIIMEAIRDRRAPASAEYLTVVTGYKKSSRNTYLQRLQASYWIAREGDDWVLTAAGIDEVGEPEALDADKLRKSYIDKLPKGEAGILNALFGAYPDGMAREEVGGDVYKKSSRNTYLQRLSARGLVVAQRDGTVRAHASLFE